MGFVGEDGADRLGAGGGADGFDVRQRLRELAVAWCDPCGDGDGEAFFLRP